jgi:hypothetical protein
VTMTPVMAAGFRPEWMPAVIVFTFEQEYTGMSDERSADRAA